MRDNWLSSHVFKSYDEILDHCCDAWNQLVNQPWCIISIGLRKWAHGFRSTLVAYGEPVSAGIRRPPPQPLAPLTKPDPVTLFPGQSPTNPYHYHCDAGDKAEQMSLERNVAAQRQHPP